MLSQVAIKEFQEIYFKEYGEVLANEEAAAIAENFLRFFKAIVKPSTKGSHNESTSYTTTTAQ